MKEVLSFPERNIKLQLDPACGGLLANLLRDDTPIWVSLSPYYAYRRTPPFVTLSGAGKACEVEVLRR